MVSYEQMFLFLRLIFSYLFMSETEKFVCRAKRNYLETRAKKIIFLIAFGNNRTEKISCVYVIRICDDNMNRFGCVLSSLIVFRLLTDLKWKKSHGCFDFLEVFFFFYIFKIVFSCFASLKTENWYLLQFVKKYLPWLEFSFLSLINFLVISSRAIRFDPLMCIVFFLLLNR